MIGTFACFWCGLLVAWFLYCGVYVVMPDGDALEWAHFLGGSALSAATAIEDEENVWTMLALCVGSGVAVAAVEAVGTPAASVGRKGGAGSRDSFVSLVVDGAANADDQLGLGMRRSLVVHPAQCSGPGGAAVVDLRHRAGPADFRKSLSAEDAGKGATLVDKGFALHQYRPVFAIGHQRRQRERGRTHRMHAIAARRTSSR